jgi:hypothetical protein
MQVLDQLRQLAGPHRPRPGADRGPLVRKVYALLGTRPAAYADGILRHMYGSGAPRYLEWATPTQLRSVVAALTYDQRRRQQTAQAR